MKALIAEDCMINRTILRGMLVKRGFEVIPCMNGKEATIALSLVDPTSLSLIVSDLHMPDMDGDELREWLKGSQFKHVPFILMSLNRLNDPTVLKKPLNEASLDLKLKAIGL
jgi:CheY-like chemotaxis protein